MYSFMVYFLLWITFIRKQECAVIRLNHGKHMKDGLEYVMQKYLNPLRKLTAELPNHAIEMQIEILDSMPNTSPSSQTPQRRLIRVINSHHQKAVKRSNDLTSPVTPDSTAAAVITSPALPFEPPLPGPPGDQMKLPVYMDDLKKALEDLEKKILSNNQGTPPPITTRGEMPCNGGPSRLPLNIQHGHPPVRNIDDIVQILKKAIHIERRPPKPMDENLEWVQIKIPKNM